jgi:GH15 family glucan-1,4-alpha-glucosidase
MNLSLRFDYGRTRPSLGQSDKEHDKEFVATGGTQRLALRSSVPAAIGLGDINAAFSLRAGEKVAFELASAESLTVKSSQDALLRKTARFWTQWASRIDYRGPHAGVVRRSLLTLKALTYAPTGGVLAASTTSVPEAIRGSRNWDYRYCWFRDATFTLLGFMHAGCTREAREWRGWLLHAIGKKPSQLKIVYDVAGRALPTEKTIRWLPGYGGSLPVRVGNAASRQLNSMFLASSPTPSIKPACSKRNHDALSNC